MNTEQYAEEFITCPYNPSHKCLKHKLQKHIYRCSKNYTGPPMVSCLFNSTHVVPKAELSAHMSSCPDRNLIDNYLHQTDDAPKYEINLKDDPVTEGEYWEDDDKPSYNPEKYCTSHKILCRLDTQPKSKRMQHRHAERQRFQQLDRYRNNYVARVERRPPHTPLSQVQFGPQITSKDIVKYHIKNINKASSNRQALSEILVGGSQAH